ncbi:hypothetical protein [Petrimonas sp.]|uniref:hypothetical protein n=1 Tax=Petrimonas sp. TaxID=2023866 RepID=UPI002FC9AD31
MKTITITLKKEEILYDVENTTYLIGNSRSTGDNFEQVSNIQNSGEGEDRNFILRSVENAFDEVKRNLSRYIDETKVAANNALMVETGDFVLSLNVVDMFNEASTDSLKSAAHGYIVSSALMDWFANVKPDEMVIYQNRKSEANISMLSSLYRKKAPARPTTIP